MNNPTHFIEVWKSGENPETKTSDPVKIEYLKAILNNNRIFPMIQTIAIWKLKLK
jgi:hypothetical protein